MLWNVRLCVIPAKEGIFVFSTRYGFPPSWE
jgi:hypothetical protein